MSTNSSSSGRHSIDTLEQLDGLEVSFHPLTTFYRGTSLSGVPYFPGKASDYPSMEETRPEQTVILSSRLKRALDTAESAQSGAVSLPLSFVARHSRLRLTMLADDQELQITLLPKTECSD